MSGYAEIIQSTASAITALAVVVGGFWAYFKYVHGRTFKSRAELNTESKLLETPGRPFIHVRVSLQNTGASKIQLDRDIQIVRVFGCDQAIPGRSPEWDRISTLPIFLDHAWVESSETIRDEVALPLPRMGKNGPWLSFRIQAKSLEGKKPRKGNPIAWGSVEVIFADEAGDSANSRAHRPG